MTASSMALPLYAVPHTERRKLAYVDQHKQRVVSDPTMMGMTGQRQG